MAVLAHGAVVKVGDGASPEVFTSISGPTSIEFTPPQPERVDVTNHDSLAREYLQGLSGEGEMTFDVQYDQSVASHKTVRDLHGVSTTTNFQMHFADGTYVSFAATVSVTFTHGVATEAQIMAVTLAISGAVTYTDP